MPVRKAFARQNEPAGGWGALKATAAAHTEQSIAISGSATLLRMNQLQGFDYLGCGWSDLTHTSSFKSFENVAKAVAWEAAARCGTPDFFAAHTVAEPEMWSVYESEMQGRITHPMSSDAVTDRYLATRWDDAIALAVRHLAALPGPNVAEFYASGRSSDAAAIQHQLFVREYGTNSPRMMTSLRPGNINTPSTDGVQRIISGFRVGKYKRPNGCCGIYCSRANPFVSLYAGDEQSHKPSYKSVPMRCVPTGEALSWMR